MVTVNIDQPNEVLASWSEGSELGVRFRRPADAELAPLCPDVVSFTVVEWFSLVGAMTADILKLYVRAKIAYCGEFDEGIIIAPTYEVLYRVVSAGTL